MALNPHLRWPGENHDMVTRGLLVRLEAKSGMDAEVEQFLTAALPMVNDEPGTTAWFAIRFGRSEYGIVDVFPDDAAREAHLSGKVAAALFANADRLLSTAPQVQRFEVLADKLPSAEAGGEITKAVLLTFKATETHEGAVADFLRGAKPLVDAEPGTIAWFAVRLDDGHYGVFDVFPDNAARFAHLTGHVPRELAKHSLELLGSMPDLSLIGVLAAKLP
jgi:quinol monooxygenase YgiN